MKLIRKYKYLITIILVLFIILLGVIIKVNLNTNKELNIDKDMFSYENEEKKENNNHEYHEYKVDIKGAIVKPGVYIGNDTTRVIDIIDMAGGLLEDSDITVINLSKKVFDEMVIIIYTKEEVEKMLNGEELNYDNIITDKEVLFPDIKNDAVIKEEINTNNETKEENKNDENTKEEISIVNINTASLDELDTLPGIGHSKAQNIIDHRNVNGKFQSIEEILNVNGIGTSLYEQIKIYITV